VRRAQSQLDATQFAALANVRRIAVFGTGRANVAESHSVQPGFEWGVLLYCYLRGRLNRSGNAFDVCCSHHVPRAIWEVMRYATTFEGRTVSINLPLEGRFALDLDGGLLAYKSPRSVDGDEITWTYTIVRAPGGPAKLKVRVPRWAGQSTSTGNGSASEPTDEPACHQIDRPWFDGDLIEVCFSHVPRIVSGHRIGRQRSHAHRFQMDCPVSRTELRTDLKREGLLSKAPPFDWCSRKLRRLADIQMASGDVTLLWPRHFGSGSGSRS
jgi:hypothetical protein